MSITKRRIIKFINFVKSITPLIAIYGGIFAILIWLLTDLTGLYDTFFIKLPLESSDFAQILGAAGTVIFTFALAILYQRQTSIQKQQEGWMKADHTPVVWVDSWNAPRNKLTFELVNLGSGVAQDMEGKVEVRPQDNSWFSESIELTTDLKSIRSRLLPPNNEMPTEFTGEPITATEADFGDVIEIIEEEWDSKKVNAKIHIQYQYIDDRDEETYVVWNADIIPKEIESLEDVLAHPEQVKENDFDVQPEVVK